MAVIAQTSSGDMTTRLLGPEDGPTAWRFLMRGGIQHVYVASQVWAGALEHRSPEGGPDIYGAFDSGVLGAILYVGNGGLAVPAGESPEEAVVSRSLNDHIQDLLETLSPKEARILSLRYGLNGEKSLSLREIGRRYQLSRERIRQIEKKAITKLRAPSCRRLLEAYVAR